MCRITQAKMAKAKKASTNKNLLTNEEMKGIAFHTPEANKNKRRLETETVKKTVVKPKKAKKIENKKKKKKKNHAR
jgi:hypothetical protein